MDASWKLPPVTEGPRRRFVGGITRFWSHIRRSQGLAEELGRRHSQSDDESEVETMWTTGEGETSRRDGHVIRKAGSEITLLPPLVNSKEITAQRALAEIGIALLGRPVTCATRKRVFRHEMSRIRSVDVHVANEEQLRDLANAAKRSGEYAMISIFYTSAFSSFKDLNDTFKLLESGPGSNLNLPLIKSAYDCLTDMPSEIQKATLKSVINCLLTNQRGVDFVSTRSTLPDDMRAYMILLQNPQFRRPSTYVVYAHLLRLVATLCESDQQIFADWLAELQPRQFSFIIQTVNNFISTRLFPPRPQDLPPAAKCSWWIPCAVRTLAVFNVANNSKHLVDFTELYNIALDHWDLVGEFHAWEAPVLNTSINAKKAILEGHAAEQMIACARNSLIGNAGITRRVAPDFDVIFLNISVRRSHLVQDSMTEILAKQNSLRKKLRVQFAGEPGLDMGGLTKEWFQLLIHKIFNPDFGMFVYHSKIDVFWFRNSGIDQERLGEYHLIGVLMGLAMYNGVILDVRFPHCCYKKLLSPPVVPRFEYGQSGSSKLGICTASLDDLEVIVPDTTRGLRELLKYEGDVESDFGLVFQASVDEYGEVHTRDLRANGKDVPVTNENRAEYVQLYVDWFVNQSIRQQFKAFYLGFHSVCTSNALLLLRPEEVELLVRGSRDFNMADLRKVTIYDGYKPDDKTVRYFWEVALKLPMKYQKMLLIFATGSDRIPAGGMKEMTFKISKMVATQSGLGRCKDMLPVSHTCFNHLILPDYQDRRLLKEKLCIAIAHGEGFGLE